MLTREAREMFIIELSRVEQRKMTVAQTDDVAFCAIMQIKIGGMTTEEAVNWYLDKCKIKNFRC